MGNNSPAAARMTEWARGTEPPASLKAHLAAGCYMTRSCSSLQLTSSYRAALFQQPSLVPSKHSILSPCLSPLGFQDKTITNATDKM